MLVREGCAAARASTALMTARSRFMTHSTQLATQPQQCKVHCHAHEPPILLTVVVKFKRNVETSAICRQRCAGEASYCTLEDLYGVVPHLDVATYLMGRTAVGSDDDGHGDQMQDKRTKTQEKNRRAQAAFRHRQKVCPPIHLTD